MFARFPFPFSIFPFSNWRKCALQKGSVCHQCFCGAALGICPSRNQFTKVKDANLTGIATNPQFNTHEVEILTNYLQSKNISYKTFWDDCMERVLSGEFTRKYFVFSSLHNKFIYPCCFLFSLQRVFLLNLTSVPVVLLLLFPIWPISIVLPLKKKIYLQELVFFYFCLFLPFLTHIHL